LPQTAGAAAVERTSLFTRLVDFNVLAAIYRRTLARRTQLVAMVGSYGKTTTSTVISHALG
jgi:UDP-N-acetylmuramyl pentapeptide synthase